MPAAIPLFLAGLAVGAALNSLADSLPPDALGVRHAPMLPRCHYCGARHAPLYWLALISVVVRGGRCEHCQAPRRARHLLVELAAGSSLALLWTWAAPDVARFLAASVIVLTFLLITVIDIEHRLILGVVIYPAIAVVGVTNSLMPDRGLAKTLIGGAVGYGLVWGMYLFAQLFSRVLAWLRRQPLTEVAFGWGDVTLAGLVGLTVGWTAILFAIPIAIFSAGFFSVAYILVQVLRRRYTPYMPIPYGPFLVLGALVMYFYGRELAAWYAAR
jgi:prepilin signal peptidase PulO-like enzyme (type II secretory pathway)